MRRFYKKHADILQIMFILILWRVYIFIIQSISYLYPGRTGYLGFIPEANFDGVFYVNISQFWYRGLDQAFFPLYPVFMQIITYPTSIPPAASGIIVSLSSLIILLFTFGKLLKKDGLGRYATWSFLFILFFPTSFFLVSVYTESLFLSLVVLSFYFTRKQKYLPAVIFAIFATATRVVGIFLLPALLYEVFLQLKDKGKNVSLSLLLRKGWVLLLTPLGLSSYMSFLWYKYADPLLFVHIQPSFGAGRSGGEIILLPQVLYRYIKIIFSVPFYTQTFIISIFELLMLIFVSVIIFLSFKKGIRKSYILFSFFALYFPTLSGTLSSLPRYSIICFVIFIYLATIKNVYIKTILLFISLFLQSIFTTLFLRGYFVS